MYILILVTLLGNNNFHLREKAYNSLKSSSHIFYSYLNNQSINNKDPEIRERCKKLCEIGWNKLSKEERFEELKKLSKGDKKFPWLWCYPIFIGDNYFNPPWDYKYVSNLHYNDKDPHWDRFRNGTLLWLEDIAEEGIPKSVVRFYLDEMWLVEEEWIKQNQ